MNLPSLADIWTYVGPLVGAIVGFIGKYLLERRREHREKLVSLQVVECVELINTRVLDEELLGPIADVTQIKVPKGGPDSELIDVGEIHFARYRLRNLSDAPVAKFHIRLKNQPRSVWTSISEGEGRSDPDWAKQLRALMKEKEASEERDQPEYPVPYLNPYSSEHEMFFDLSSYLPLDEVEITGGAQGVKFVFRKSDS